MAAHDGSTQGISSIVELKNPSQLITGGKAAEGDKFLVSAARDLPEILIWKLSEKDG